ncbi:TetR/AcrR family transcriptional regulator [Paenarthrobacter sp. NPDC058040]|uniref:TetR/AcrR family transcriptional regulator n=1 Tax=unclassified Paenarthrobacter TaxID=2634190 RepID=UPI0036D800E9
MTSENHAPPTHDGGIPRGGQNLEIRNAREASVRPSPRRTRRYDPQRKQRIVEAALLVVAETGVAGTSLRRIAAQADVPLGSLTYHFAGMQDLLRAVFRQFVDAQLDRLDVSLSGISDPDEACAELVAFITEESPSASLALALTREFQALVLHDEECLPLVTEWIEGSLQILERCFDPETARILEVLLDGLAFRRVALKQTDSRFLGEDLLAKASAANIGSARKLRRKQDLDGEPAMRNK